MLKSNEFVEKFNQEERKRRRSILRKLKRPAGKALEKFAEAIERREPKDCVSRKWIK